MLSSTNSPHTIELGAEGPKSASIELYQRLRHEWGAGHAAELSYIFPSAPLFNGGERAPAETMKRYWGAFVKQGGSQR